MADNKLEEVVDLLADYGGFDKECLRGRLLGKSDGLSRMKDITLEIAYHENKIAMHKRAINKLRKEKSILMANGEWKTVDDGK
jgi:hypothetical protein